MYEGAMGTDSRDDTLFHVAAGGLSALALGVVLTPLREVTSAANLAFAFVVLTIVVGELGGSLAATVTALMSALSLDFFLTKPYLRLAIDEKDASFITPVSESRFSVVWRRNNDGQAVVRAVVPLTNLEQLKKMPIAKMKAYVSKVIKAESQGEIAL